MAPPEESNPPDGTEDRDRQVLDYGTGRQHDRPAPAGSVVASMLKFLGGVAIGSAFSGLLWSVAFDEVLSNFWSFVTAAMIVLLLKVGLAGFFSGVPGWRSFGVGLLISIAVGALIFTSTCGRVYWT